MAQWKDGKCVVYEDRHGNTRCGACCEPLFCNENGDMPDTCPNCGAPLDYSIYRDLDELYELTQREYNGERLTPAEVERYVALYEEIHALGGDIPFPVEI